MPPQGGPLGLPKGALNNPKETRTTVVGTFQGPRGFLGRPGADTKEQSWSIWGEKRVADQAPLYY